jgi:hypothetical protein
MRSQSSWGRQESEVRVVDLTVRSTKDFFKGKKGKLNKYY